MEICSEVTKLSKNNTCWSYVNCLYLLLTFHFLSPWVIWIIYSVYGFLFSSKSFTIVWLTVIYKFPSRGSLCYFNSVYVNVFYLTTDEFYPHDWIWDVKEVVCIHLLQWIHCMAKQFFITFLKFLTLSYFYYSTLHLASTFSRAEDRFLFAYRSSTLQSP